MAAILRNYVHLEDPFERDVLGIMDGLERTSLSMYKTRELDHTIGLVPEV